jgi:amidase
MAADDLAGLDANAQAELVRHGDTTPRELVDAAIERIERIDGQLNAVIHRRFEQARAEADGRLPDGPFRGVPLVLKDLGCYSEGDPYHAGTRLLKNIGYVADHDSYVTEKFRAAGFVIVGRTNTPELGSTITTEPLAHGASRNPWNTDHSTGGSSGGSGAAVAAGLVPLAHATDGGGSIRIPAAMCGLVGLKPSRGRISLGPDKGESWMGCSTSGVVSRTVRDTASALDAISGAMPGDAYMAPPPERPFAAEVGVDPGTLRIGLLDHPILRDGDPDPECAAAVQSAGKLLESLGHRVEVAWPDAYGEEEAATHFTEVIAVHTAVELGLYEDLVGRSLTDDDIEPVNLAFGALGDRMTAREYLAAVQWVHRWSRRLMQWWRPADGSPGFDLLVTPVLNGTPPLLGWVSDPDYGVERLLAMQQYTSQCNLSGQPAVSLPLHWTPDDLPVGVHFVADYGREDVLIRVAAQVEAAQPWAQRRPAVFA